MVENRNRRKPLIGLQNSTELLILKEPKIVEPREFLAKSDFGSLRKIPCNTLRNLADGVPGLWREHGWGPESSRANMQMPRSLRYGRGLAPDSLRLVSLQLLSDKKGHPRLWRGAYHEGWGSWSGTQVQFRAQGLVCEGWPVTLT